MKKRCLRNRRVPPDTKISCLSLTVLVLPKAEVIRVGERDQEAEDDDERDDLNVVKSEDGGDCGRVDLVLNEILEI